MKAFGRLYYPLGGNGPKHARASCWVYFIQACEFDGRARGQAFAWIDPLISSYDAGVQLSKIKGWQLICSPMELVTRPVSTDGSQAVRYVMPGEEKAFELAFVKSAGRTVRRGRRSSGIPGKKSKSVYMERSGLRQK